MELLTAAQMRAIEQAAIESGQVTGLELMERAGRGVVDAIFAEWPELAGDFSAGSGAGGEAGGFPPPDPRGYLGTESEGGRSGGPRRAVVLCGPGNNGGDGFVVARLLRERGWGVEVFLYGDPDRLPPDARVNYERWRGMGEVVPVGERTGRLFWHYGDHDRPDLWIDAVFGIGLSRDVSEDVGRLLQEAETSLTELIERSGGKFIAVDFPTGIDSDTGILRMAPGAPQAVTTFFKDDGWMPRANSDYCPTYHPWHCDMTVTFHREKLGHRRGVGPQYCGRIAVVDIGVDPFDMRAGSAE